jgi:hypothetical protein
MADSEQEVGIKNMRSTHIVTFWDVRPCCTIKVNGRFGALFGLHAHGRRISPERNRPESRWGVARPGLALRGRRRKMDVSQGE